MESSKEGELPSETAPETLPTEIKEERKKFPMLLAVIIVVILVIAAVGVAFSLGVIGKKKQTNLPPLSGAAATSATTINIGDHVSFNSTAKVQTKGATLTNWTWYFGDGDSVTGGKELTDVTHTYAYGGFYWVLLVVKDSNGLNGTNEASMVRVTVAYYDPQPKTTTWDNSTHPYASLLSNNDIIAPGTQVTFNMTGTYGIGGWSWTNTSNHSEGANQWYGMKDLTGSRNLTYVKQDFGDGSPVVSVKPSGTSMVATHNYTKSGHYAATMTAYSINTNPFHATNVSTIVMRTIHVLAPGTSSSAIVRNPGSFIEATIGEPDTLDPAIDYETSGGNILQNCYETLLWYNTNTTTLIPWLATAIPSVANGLISTNGLNYTFNLRQNVHMHDGTIMNASDVVFSLQRVLIIHDPSSPDWMLEQALTDNIGFNDGSTASDYLAASSNVTWIRDIVAPGGDYSHVITQTDIVAVAHAAVLKVNDTAVKFRLTHVFPGFLAIMAYTVADVVSMEYVLAHGNVYSADKTKDPLTSHEAGSGPYSLVDWQVGSKMHLTSFASWWGVKTPDTRLKDVYIIKSEDVNTRMLMLQAGDADNIYLPISYQDQFLGKAAYAVKKGEPSLDLTFFVFNFNIDAATANSVYHGTITNNFFQDVHMRSAFVHLFDYATFIHNTARDNAIEPNGAIPKGLAGYNASVPVYTYDLALAASEMKLTQNPNHPGQSWFQTGFKIPLFFNSGNTGRQTACRLIQQSLQTMSLMTGAGAMDATITGLDWSSAYLPEVLYAQHSYAPMYAIGWAPDYADSSDYATPILDSTYGTYPIYSGYNNTTIDNLVRAANSALDPTVRIQLYGQLEQKVYQDVPYLWLTQPNNFNILRAWVHGYYYNPMYSDLYYASFTKS